MSRRMNTRPLLALLCAALGLAAAQAAHAAEPYTCRNGGFPLTIVDPGLARVIPAKLHFRKDDPDCPEAGASVCEARGYVLAGDRVLTGQSSGDWVCILYPGKDGGSAGWVRRDQLKILPIDRRPALAAWAGRWRRGDDEITLRVRGAAITANGEAWWPSANPPLSERPGGPNMGNMDGRARPAGNSVSFGDNDADDCRVDLRLVGDWLVARDNMHCGGMNVSFTGVYKRGKAGR